MAISLEEANKFRAMANLPPLSEIELKSPVISQGSDDILQKRKENIERINQEIEQQKKQQVASSRSGVERFTDNFIGGNKIARGLGEALAQRSTNRKIKQTQESQFGVQGNLIKAIHDARAEGKDTSRLENALTELGYDIAGTGEGAEDQLNPSQLTNKQVIGDALQLATTVGTIGGVSGAGTKYATGPLSKVPGLTKQAVGPVSKIASKLTGRGMGVLKGAAQGTIAGTTSGAIAGGLEGAAQGLQQDEDTRGVVNKALGGAAPGAAGGAVLGGITGGISGGIKGSKIAKKEFTQNLVTPPLDKQVTESALRTGKVQEGEGLLGKRRFTDAIPNVKEIKKSVDTVPGVSPKKTNLQNLNAIHDEIGNEAQRLRTKIRGKGNFTPEEFTEYMQSVRSELAENPVLVGDAEKTADKILNKFDSLIKEEGYTGEGLLDARQKLDVWMASQKGTGIFDPAKENATSIALRSIRQGGNNFLADRIPDAAVKQSLKHQSNLYQAVENIVPKAAKEGKSRVARFFGTSIGKDVKNVLIGAAGAGALGVGARAVSANND